MRRSTFTDQSVNYGAIGATLDPDLLRYPPAGFRPNEQSVRIGSGRERFERTSEALMTWGVQEGAGLLITDISEGSGTEYVGVAYAADGTPSMERPDRSGPRYDARGVPFIAPGMTAKLRHPRQGLHRRHQVPVLVVYVVDEPDRVGYAYGTMAGPERGEESFVLEHREDDTVWLTIRSIYRRAGGRGGLGPVLRRRREELTKRQLRALHPAGGL
ncbi:DUF1990 family protein [Agromyces archimandritae]|uniref:DUF1990 family protein n=1 Tax=Agromyces archimandritae TaxID=2781962 RepID=A0A975FN02_9MICO|nr:DUF1990 family protein [Agromyces archimandritae]QTX04874.1 DUF1990 family protein [Agromyces archimandritae]